MFVERLSVWRQPRYALFCLASLYALENLLYFSTWWSLGLSASFSFLAIGSLILSPLVGIIWLYFTGWIFHFTGRWLKGQASPFHLRTALAWARLPSFFSVFMWFILLGLYPETVFIQDAGAPSSLLINFVTLIVFFWSFVLLVQSIRKVQGFSFLRSASNIVLAWFISSLSYFLCFIVFRYFCLNVL